MRERRSEGAGKIKGAALLAGRQTNRPKEEGDDGRQDDGDDAHTERKTGKKSRKNATQKERKKERNKTFGSDRTPAAAAEPTVYMPY